MDDEGLFASTEWQEYAQHVIDDLVPMIQDSSVTVALVPDCPVDVKMAVEIGVSVMLDKPILALVTPGTKVPAKLVAIADRIVEGDLSDPTVKARFEQALREVLPGKDDEEEDSA